MSCSFGKLLRWGAVPLVAAVGASVYLTTAAWAGGGAGHGWVAVAGGGVSVVEGGTGGSTPAPVITNFACHAAGSGGDFECLALTPSAASGNPGSGTFDKNVMYVTGHVSSVTLASDSTAILTGTATVVGIGAGTGKSFTVTVTKGGPGATLDLQVSGTTFDETVQSGQMTISS